MEWNATPNTTTTPTTHTTPRYASLAAVWNEYTRGYLSMGDPIVFGSEGREEAVKPSLVALWGWVQQVVHPIHPQTPARTAT